MRRATIELAAAYNELVERHDYLEDELQKRIADVRVLKKKYSTLQEESERYAVKVVDKARASRHKALLALANEVRACRACRHSGVARLVEAIQTPAKLYLVLEHGGEDLYALVTRLGGEGAAALSEKASRSVLSQVAVALGALERMGVVHHDVKAENVLVGEDASADFVGAVKVTDLGLARFYDRGATASAFCGSRGFYPPEMALRAGGYDPFRADVWSVGCVAAELLLGRAWFSYKWLPCYGSDRDADVFARASSAP
ncbi:protein kinase [Aureococcus anophagefferens]|nr:protein kinase [Aureococcus anophagefferens]